VPPADEPHGTRHSKLSALLEAHAAAEYDVASDMLTRTSEANDFAPDASVFPKARNPETGGRQLEELAFEVASTERLSRAARKASELSRRGVRRVFALDVERQRAFEWSRDLGTWSLLANDSTIEDPVFAAPLPVEALVKAAKADDAMAAALLEKRNPVLQAALAASRAEGKVEGKAEALLALLAARGLEPTDAERSRILQNKDAGRLDQWFERALHAASVAELIGSGASSRAHPR